MRQCDIDRQRQRERRRTTDRMTGTERHRGGGWEERREEGRGSSRLFMTAGALGMRVQVRGIERETEKTETDRMTPTERQRVGETSASVHLDEHFDPSHLLLLRP